MEKKKRFGQDGSGLGVLGSVFIFWGNILEYFQFSCRQPASLEAKKVAESSRLTLEGFMADPANQEFQKLIKKAKGVYITPSLLKGAFVVGVSGGNGLLLIRDKVPGKWMGPAFFYSGGSQLRSPGRRGSLGGCLAHYDRPRGKSIYAEQF